MKGSGYHHHQSFDHAAGAGRSSPVPRATARRVAAVLLVAVLLACVEREIGGTAEGSLASVLTGHVAKGAPSPLAARH